MMKTQHQNDSLFELATTSFGQSRSEAVLNHLTTLIADGRLAAGDTLPAEGEMASRFSVSKPTVREALRKLEMMGVIEIVHGRGSSVRRISAEPLQIFLRLAVGSLEHGLAQVIEFRRAIEVTAAGLAARNGGADQHEALRVLMAQMESAAAKHDSWVAWDTKFHTHIARMTGNTLIAFMIEALRPIMEQTISRLHGQKALRDAAMTLKRHEAIADALLARDAAKAQAAMDEHFDASLPVATSLLQAAEDKGD